MHVGLVMECDYRYGETEEAAFDEAFAMAEAAEMGGLNGVWRWRSGISPRPAVPLTPAAPASRRWCQRR